MKINPMQSVNAYKKLQEVQQKQENKAQQKSDKLEISSEAMNMAKTSEFQAARQERVEALKQQVQDGTYKPDPMQTARNMYDFWNK
ncbi:flagellar biosynthesis anti-sigma factor FlgM [Alkalicoccus urumqiensis]|uniref:Negative regulator of flagellin synthesis n=1 Tax=Alkalicoccus urumqiensis TaxID=1548213 RepID=A0A2P6MHA1_ALKUR|nr:flagellar biosynthesis anti-sigma factor FlgM [Alkalicoccus urumqiensis]PRO65666.1 flagellar biosynthesis anti-sigma factor FlgM [Alkalicoccus urumqiensis]